MANTVTLGGNPVPVNGNLPQPGQAAPAFSLVGKTLADVTLADFAGKRKVLNPGAAPAGRQGSNA